MPLFELFEDEETKPVKRSRVAFDPLADDVSPSDNVSTARLAIVGDIPTIQELKDRTVFKGPAGGQLSRILAAANLPRYDCYLTNACKARVPGNSVSKLWTDKGYRHSSWGLLQKKLIDELREYTGKIIVTMGPLATALILDEQRYTDMTKYAGSVYATNDFPHLREALPDKFIAVTHHTRDTLPNKQPVLLYVVIAHIMKFLRLDEDPELYLSPRVVVKTRPLYHEVIEHLHTARTHKSFAFDIEATPRYTTCFSVAIKNEDRIISMSIPLMDNRGNYWTLEEETDILIALAELLADPACGMIAQNGMFDIMYQLRTMNMVVDNFAFDTMIAQNICYTDLPKGLDFLTSAYTYYPYYKDEGKQSHLKAIKDWDMYWEYNGKDSAYLLPIADAMYQELIDVNAVDTMEQAMALHKPLMEMEWNGIFTDQPGILKIKEKFKRYIKAMKHGLKKLSGQELNINSPKQMVNYFYTTCGIKPYLGKPGKNGKRNPTCNAVALARIAKKGVKGSYEARLIMKIRFYHKLLTTYFRINVDSDHKLRCSYQIAGTSSGRLSSRATYFGTGANLQNQPYIYKHYLKPDKDYILVENDLQRAEAHVVAFLCQDESMINAFESGIDVHTFNASKIFSTPMDQVTKHQRGLGKRVVHARNYLMGPATFSDKLAKDFIFFSQGKCKSLLQAYSDRFPNLGRWQQQIQREVCETRTLYNLFGRPKRFLEILNDATFRNAISYIPQSTVAELLNRGIIKASNDPRLGRDGYDIDFLTTVHDSVVYQVPIKHLDELRTIFLIMKDHMSHTFTHLGRSFTIGLDSKIGHAWAGPLTAEVADFSQEAITNALNKIGL